MTPPRLPSGPRQPGFFDPAEVGPTLRPRPPVIAPLPVEPAKVLDPAQRPADWREPTKGEEVCRGCAGAACYGQDGQWFCYHCRPAGFLPKDRGEVGK